MLVHTEEGGEMVGRRLEPLVDTEDGGEMVGGR